MDWREGVGKEIDGWAYTFVYLFGRNVNGVVVDKWVFWPKWKWKMLKGNGVKL